jgi:hypothetical protein
MPTLLLYETGSRTLFKPDGGGRFDAALRTWSPAAPPRPADCIEVTTREAVRRLQSEPRTRIRAPVAVIGPREATATQETAAALIGRSLAELGFAMLCGGKTGVMEAACAGVAAVPGGVSIGLLPDDDAAAANAHVTVPIATGIGVARNAIIARAAFALIAVGGGYGTLSEIALALQFGKTVFTIEEAPAVAGTIPCPDASAAIDALCRYALAL